MSSHSPSSRPYSASHSTPVVSDSCTLLILIELTYCSYISDLKTAQTVYNNLHHPYSRQNTVSNPCKAYTHAPVWHNPGRTSLDLIQGTYSTTECSCKAEAPQFTYILVSRRTSDSPSHSHQLHIYLRTSSTPTS